MTDCGCNDESKCECKMIRTFSQIIKRLQKQEEIIKEMEMRINELEKDGEYRNYCGDYSFSGDL